MSADDTKRNPTSIALRDGVLVAIDSWAARHHMSRSQAIGEIIERYVAIVTSESGKAIDGVTPKDRRAVLDFFKGRIWRAAGFADAAPLAMRQLGSRLGRKLGELSVARLAALIDESEGGW
jgi:hypothetical protein